MILHQQMVFYGNAAGRSRGHATHFCGREPSRTALCRLRGRSCPRKTAFSPSSAFPLPPFLSDPAACTRSPTSFRLATKCHKMKLVDRFIPASPSWVMVRGLFNKSLKST